MKRRIYVPFLALLLGLLLVAAPVHAATLPPLGTAASFGVLAASTVTNTGLTHVIGDVGVSPGTAVVGFPPGTLTGVIHAGDAVALQAQQDATIAYNDAAGQACDQTLTGQDLGGLTLTPGVYCFTSSAQLTGQLTLDGQGDPASVFIFQIGSTLITASNSSVLLINGAQLCRIFWQVGSSATLGTTTDFSGHILAQASITLNTGATSDGGLYALTGAVTLDSNQIQSCGPLPTATPLSTSTPLPLTNTPTVISVPPTTTPVNTPVPPTNTPVPPTNTPLPTRPPGNTPVPPTLPPAITEVPPTVPPLTPVPPTLPPVQTPVPPTLPPVQTPVPMETTTALPAATETAMVAATATALATQTALPAATETAVVVATATALATQTALPAATASAVATQTALPAATASAVAVATATAQATVTVGAGTATTAVSEGTTGGMPRTGGPSDGGRLALLLVALLLGLGLTLRWVVPRRAR